MEKEKIDYLPMIRAMIKMSAALNYADSIETGKYFKFRFKKEMVKWVDMLEELSKPIVGDFAKDSEHAFQDSYQKLLEFKSDVIIKDRERTDLIMFYCKVRSSANDMKEVNFNNGGFYILSLKKQTEKVLKAIENQYADIFNIRDMDGDSIEVIIKDYDSLGKSMFVKE